MEELLTSYNSILLITSIFLTVISSYIALDLFSMIGSVGRNEPLLFAGGTFSLGIGIWIMNFMFAVELTGSTDFNIPVTLLAILVAICFIGMAFYALNIEHVKLKHLCVASFLMTCAVFSNEVIGVYGLNLIVQFHSVILWGAALILFYLFFFVFWLLYYSKLTINQAWLKLFGALIIAGAGAVGHFLLIRTATLKASNPGVINEPFDQSFLIYVTLFVAILILSGLIGTSVIVSKKLADSETYLKESMKKINDINFALDQSSIVAFTDASGIITSANEKFCEISKYSQEELIGKDHRILNSSYHSKQFFKDLWKTISEGKVWKGEIRNKAKDGSLYWVFTTIVPFIDENGKPYQYLAIRNDITEQKKAEEILHRQDKLAAVGQLAAGVAHEIRNPLTSMRGYTEFLLEDETDLERREFIEIILDEIGRVNEIVEDFMVLAKPKKIDLEEKNIVPIIKDVLSLLEFEARKKHVRIHFEAFDDIVQIECDENRLKQVFLNFVKNGIEAMPNGGDITIRITVLNDQVQISIQDTGVGIPEDKLKKIGEPFFTTKKNGNGLGLMVSFKIIESHNGTVYIESELNKGTTFNIVLPAKIA